MQRLNRNGQSFIEYTVVIACVVVALLAMQVYIQRALQGRLRTAADEIGEQYDPKNTETAEEGITITVNRDVTTHVYREDERNTPIDGKMGFGTYREETIHQDETTRKGTETVGEYDAALGE